MQMKMGAIVVWVLTGLQAAATWSAYGLAYNVRTYGQLPFWAKLAGLLPGMIVGLGLGFILFGLAVQFDGRSRKTNTGDNTVAPASP